MKKYTLNLLFCFLCISAYCQVSPVPKPQVLKETEDYWSNWKKDLYDVGISLQKDSLKVSSESKRIMHDSAYRNLLFPAQYTWAKATAFLKAMELKKATWFLIKLYIADSANKQLAIQSLVPFDKAVEMDKVLISSFYTYALLDPQICIFKNNRVMITHPDVLEKEFSQVKEMISYIRAYRSMAAKAKMKRPK